MRKHEQILNQIETLLNTKRGKETAQNFKKCLIELKKNHGITLSTKFLRNLIQDGKDNRQKTYRIRYLLRQTGLKTKRQNRYFNDWENQIKNIDVKTFGYSDLNKIDKTRLNNNELKQVEKLKPYELTDEEKQIISEFKQVEIETGIELFNYVENSFNKRENKRKWIYSFPLNSIVTLKNIRQQKDVNVFFKVHRKEVLFFIEGF